MVKLSTIKIEGRSLIDNPLKDPTERDVTVISPDMPAANAPLFVYLPSFGSTSRSIFNVTPFGDDFLSRIQKLHEANAIRGAVIAVPDLSTKIGGNLFMNSTAVGNYEDFMVSDLIPGLRQQLGIENIGLFGKSSGGFGSYNLAVRNPGIVQGFCAHSMDCGFEYAYIQDMVLAMDQFRKAGGPSKWFQRFLASRNKTSSLNIRVLNTMASSAFFSPNESSTEMGIDFPFDWDSGEFRKDVWAKWKQVDPAETVKDYLRQLETLNYVYMDCGTMDEFNLIWGNRYVNRVLVDGNIRHYYEEYEDGHFGIQYRFEKSLALMAASL